MWKLSIFMAALRSSYGHSITPMVSSFFSSFFSLPILSRRRLDVYYTSTHDVALVQI